MRFRIEHVHHLAPEVEGLLRRGERKLDLILRQQELIMATLDDTLAKVTQSGDRLDSLIIYVEGLKKQLEDALAGVTLPPAVQAKVDAIFTEAEENAAKTDTALNANVPPAPPA